MSERTDLHGLSTVAETMLITLWARAREAGRVDAVVRDDEARRIAASLEVDDARFAGGWKTQVGVAVRTRYMDEAVRAFIARHPEATIVNVGAGLDARFGRVDNGRIHWIDLDLPEAIALRRRFFAPSVRQTFIAASACDPGWEETVTGLGRPAVLVVAEGVLMFIERERVRALLDRLAAAFPAGEAIFDLIGGLMVRFPRLHDTLPATGARFEWGLRGRRELERWSRRYEVVRVRSMLDESPRRWRWMRWLRIVPALSRQFVVAHVRFDDRGRDRGRDGRE